MTTTNNEVTGIDECIKRKTSPPKLQNIHYDNVIDNTNLRV